MSGLDDVLSVNRDAVEDMAAAAERCGDGWTTPSAPGKWSPSQVVEHVALSLEESAKAINGEPTRFPRFPRVFHPVLRAVFLRRVIRKGGFPKARTNKAMDPPSGPETPAAARTRLESAMGAYEQACRLRAKSGATFRSSIFGNVGITEYAEFQALHTRHHRRQLPS
ncbi:MAG TPA: DUF1569 domain-containing protein [Gemmatimonadaceae bacterium]